MVHMQISQKSSDQLSDISKKRKEEQALIHSKKGVNEELIDKAHRKEIKK